MVFLTTLLFIVAAATTFVVIFTVTPFMYEMWYDNLRDQNSPAMQAAGDRIFGAWQVMTFIVPGLLIIAGIAVANRKRAIEESEF